MARHSFISSVPPYPLLSTADPRRQPFHPTLTDLTGQHVKSNNQSIRRDVGLPLECLGEASDNMAAFVGTTGCNGDTVYRGKR